VVLSLIAFCLSKQVPQDPVLSLMDREGSESPEGFDVEAYTKKYLELELNKPNFYLSIAPNHYPISFNTISDPTILALTKRLTRMGLPYKKTKIVIEELSYDEINNSSDEELRKLLQNKYKLVAFPVPTLRWHGIDNQYHRWLTSFLSRDFGVSFVSGRPVYEKIISALLWTASLAFIVILFEFIVGIFLGYWLSHNPEGRWKKSVDQLLYIFYAIPFFWLATMMIIFFTTADYGKWTDIFPSPYINIYPGESTWYHIIHNLDKFILPVLLGCIGSIAIIAKMLKRSIANEMQSPYILTAYSKGLTHKQVIQSHALPNALIPIITVLAGAIPNTFLLADILYAYVNPRIRYN